MLYKCEFPGCEYTTSIRSQIQKHHIIPVENSGSDKPYNRIFLCPTHHTKIYCPTAEHGIHTVKGNDSIILVGWINSTGGRLLEYIDEKGISQYKEIR